MNQGSCLEPITPANWPGITRPVVWTRRSGSTTAGGTLSISNGLTINAGATNYFDLSDDLTGLVKASDGEKADQGVLPIPTMIVWGSRDRMIPAWHALSVQRALPDCRVELFEGAGHFPHLDDPDRFARVLREFIADSSGAGPGAATEG